MAEAIEHIASVAQNILTKEEASDPVIRKIMKLVHAFIQKKRVLCYGGTAINNIIPKKDQFYDFTVDIPDYDFFSEDPTAHAKELVDILVHHGIENVEAKPGVHLGTFKVFAKYTGVADISSLDKPIFNKLWKESIEKDGIHYVPPNFLRMSMYLELSRPRGDVSRWKKVYTRLMLLNNEYPVHCTEKDKTFHDEKVPEQLKHEIEEKLKETVLLGFNAFNEHEKKKQWVLPIDILINKEDAKDVVASMQDSFLKTGKVKVYEYPEYAELLPAHYDIVDNKGRLLVRAFETNACHSYHETNSGMRLASIPTLLNFLFAMMYADKHFIETTTHNRLICACQELVDMANNGRKRRFKLLTPIDCIGDQKNLRDMKKERAELYSELSRNRHSEEFLKYFFSYVPKKKEHKFLGGNLSRMFPRKNGLDYSKLKMTPEGQYSITKPRDGEHIIKVMSDALGTLEDKTIADLTGNVGGDTIRFGMHFKHVDSYELNEENFAALKNNVEVYGLKNITLHRGDSTALFKKKVDVVYIDAPWGGPDYKEKTELDLFLGDVRVDVFAKKLKQTVFMKVPNNYNFGRFEGTDHEIFEIGKFKLILIKRNS